MKRPNILLFLTDDHGAWATGCYGNGEIESPVLDSLARGGTHFSNAFTPSPVCSPARACLITGRTPSQVGIHDWLQNPYDKENWLSEEMSLPQLLRTVGYRCALAGKWHLGQDGQRPTGFDWQFGLLANQGRHIEEYSYMFNGEIVTKSGNKTAFITDYALDFLAQTPPDKPFFLNVGYISTHSPYANQDAELVARYNKATFGAIPRASPHPWCRDEDASSNIPFEEERNRWQSYYAAVTDIDRNIGRILDTLREQNRLEETLVVYTSDHGCALGHHGFWGKGNATRPLNMHETSLRVPLIWHLPNAIQAGQVVRNCVDHYDTFQTICDLAGIELENKKCYPGRSYQPLLRGEMIQWDDTRFGEYGDLRMIRTPEWKLVRRYPSGPHDLFDLQNDPQEMHNRVGQVELHGIESELGFHLETWFTRHESSAKSGLRIKALPRHNVCSEAWRDGIREERGLQLGSIESNVSGSKLDFTSQ